MKFTSKKDIFFFLIIWGCVIGMLLSSLYTSNSQGTAGLISKSVGGLIIILLLWFWFGTSYSISGGHLVIKYVPFKWKIKISNIHRITHVKSPFTAPALSISRLEILYNKYEVIQISPKDKEEFISELRKISTSIQL